MADLTKFLDGLVPNPIVRTIVIAGLAVAMIHLVSRGCRTLFKNRPEWKFRRELLELAAALVVVLLAVMVLPLSEGETRRYLLYACGLAGVLYFILRPLPTWFEGREQLTFRRQILQLVGVFLLILASILVYSKDTTQTALLSLFGLVLSATIALSSTTLVGNVMAGLMMKTVGNFGLGNYVRIGDYSGKVTEMDLLHTQVETDQRDLVTLPNLYMVTNPVRVLSKKNGTVLSVDLSLGYDVSRHQVEQLLVEAAAAAGLDNAHVLIRELGDFSVTYSVRGVLAELDHLLAKRRELRARTIDALHAAGIEIVSPTFMNTRAYADDKTFIARVKAGDTDATPETNPDAVAFPKGQKAESLQSLRGKLETQRAALKERDEIIANSTEEAVKETAAKEREMIGQYIDRLKVIIEKKQAKMSEE